eukprot:COSAG05_NODE_6086_length_1024_cov_409.888649_1_plen_48_part_10
MKKGVRSVTLYAYAAAAARPPHTQKGLDNTPIILCCSILQTSPYVHPL